MSVSRRYLTLLSLWILSLMSIYCQDSITFSPDRAPCVGDPIEMICSIVPPSSETFGSSVAFVSINGSTAFSLTQLNTNSVLDGIDLSRYSANADGLNPSTDMPVIRLIINSYLPLDSNTTFRCATTFLNGSVYDSTVYDSPMRQAAISSFEGTTTITILSDCAIQISFSAQISSNKLTDLNYTFTLLDEEGVVLESTQNVTDSLTPSVTFSTTFKPDVCYNLTVSVKNCLNGDETTASLTYFSLQVVSNSTGVIQSSSTNSNRFEWKYNTNMNCSNNYADLILTEGLFSFNLIKDNSIAYNITEYSVYLPDRFDFYIPPVMDSEGYSLRISLCDRDLTQQDIPITLLTLTGNTVTVVLGVLVGLLIILFIVIVILIVLFLIFFYLKRNTNKK